MRLSPRKRLALLVLVLAATYVAFLVLRPFDEQSLRDAIDPLGAWAPLAFVPLSALLGVALVPGALLATTAGLLFGTWTGFAAALAASVLSAVLAREIAHHSGRSGFEDVAAGRRGERAAAAVQRGGIWSVIVQRLAPWVPDGPSNYAFGLVGITRVQLALGTLIGAAPRALGYTALGDSLDDLNSPGGALAAGLLLGTGLLGLLLLARTARGGARRAETQPEA